MLPENIMMLVIVVLLVVIGIFVIVYFSRISENKHCTNNNIFCSDLDGTLMKGDITEGHPSYFMGITQYLYSIPGLIKSTTYPTYEKYSDVYFKRLEQNDIGAFLMPCEIYNPDQDEHISKHWEDTIQRYFVNYTKRYLQQKLDEGKQVWIVSASPLIYIKPIVKYLAVSKIVAIELDKVITYGPGKVKRVRELTDSVLTNIGGYTADSWNNDSNLFTTLRNVNPCAELQWINHYRSTTNDLYKNLSLFNIANIIDYVDPVLPA